MRRMNWEEVASLARRLADDIDEDERIWGIPRGGTPVAAMLSAWGFVVVDSPEKATVAVDDIVDTGSTRDWILREYGLATRGLIDRPAGKDGGYGDEWIVFPWEDPEDAAAPGIDGVRFEVAEFAREMERALSRSAYKGHWSRYEDAVLLRDLSDEVGRLSDALRGGNPKETTQRAAATAALAMSLADNHRKSSVSRLGR